MATPTSGEIRDRAVMLYMSDPGRGTGYGEGNIGTQQTPEDKELREGGYFEEARNQLMRESARIPAEDKERILKRKAELNEELSQVREALGYRPRTKKAKVEELVQAAKQQEPSAIAGTVDVASREELVEALPPVVVEPVQLEEVRPEIDEDALVAAAALPRAQRRERQNIPSQIPEPKVPKPPPAHKQLSASFRKAFRSTNQKLIDYERDLRARDEANRKREAEEQRELKMFAREVNLAKRKRIILARATADVERVREAAGQGYGSGESPARGLYTAAQRAVARRLQRPVPLQQGFEEGYPNEEQLEQEENLNPYGANFGRFPSHRYPAYSFPSGKPRKRLHFRLGEPKPGARPSRGPKIRTSWSFSSAIKGSTRPPSYNKRAVPYSFSLVRPEDRELSEAQGRISE